MGRRARALKGSKDWSGCSLCRFEIPGHPEDWAGRLSMPFLLDYGVMLALLFLIEFFTGVIIDLCVAVRNN